MSRPILNSVYIPGINDVDVAELIKTVEEKERQREASIPKVDALQCGTVNIDALCPGDVCIEEALESACIEYSEDYNWQDGIYIDDIFLYEASDGEVGFRYYW